MERENRAVVKSMEGEGKSIVGIYGKRKSVECRSLWKEKTTTVVISMEGEGQYLWKEKANGV